MTAEITNLQPFPTPLDTGIPPTRIHTCSNILVARSLFRDDINPESSYQPIYTYDNIKFNKEMFSRAHPIFSIIKINFDYKILLNQFETTTGIMSNYN